VNGRYYGCNQAYEVYMGIEKESFIGKTVYDIVSREMADLFDALMKSIIPWASFSVILIY
jgi:hypothetical protein